MARLTDLELRILEKPSIECEDVTALLGDYVDNELSPSLRDRVHCHIRGCKECQEGEAGYREVISLAKELPEKPVTEDIQKRLREALNKRLGLNLSL
jgi:anti-sigma factor RsiW